ncbi:MAG: hypothetical protein R3F17_12040 [Planctomycetota bacterium]
MHEDQRSRTTLDPKSMRRENVFKVLIVIAMSGLYALMLTGDHGFGMGQGMGIGLPIVLGYVLWDWAGRRTRKRSMYDHGLVWPLAMSSLGWLMGIWILGAGLVSGPDHRDMIRLGAGIALVSCIPVLIAWFLRRRRAA